MAMRSLTSTHHTNHQLPSSRRFGLLPGVGASVCTRHTSGVVEFEGTLLHTALAKSRHPPDVETLVLAITRLLALKFSRLAAHEVIVDIAGTAKLQSWTAD